MVAGNLADADGPCLLCGGWPNYHGAGHSDHHAGRKRQSRGGGHSSNTDRALSGALTEFGTAWLRDAGMRVAMIGTGGDPGHAPARRVYAKADYTLIPMARYFKAL